MWAQTTFHPTDEVVVERLAKLVRERRQGVALPRCSVHVGVLEQVVDPPVAAERLQLAVALPLREVDELLAERQALVEVLDAQQRGVPALERGRLAHADRRPRAPAAAPRR